MIKKLILFSIGVVALYACDHNLPIAKLKFLKVEKVPQQKDYYYIWFTSDIELKNRLKEKHIGAHLTCFPSSTGEICEDNFGREYDFKIISFNDMKEIDNTPYTYRVKTVLQSDATSESENSVKQLYFKTIIQDNKTHCFPCAVYAVTYMNITKRYISETMCIPIESFL